MSHVLKIKFGQDIHSIIKLYTGEACWRNGKYIHIHKIPKNDPRYAMLRKKPRIKQVHNDNKDDNFKGMAWFKLANGKFVVILVRYGYERVEGNTHILGHFWEMYYNEYKDAVFIG
jgi:hypothetical protein